MLFSRQLSEDPEAFQAMFNALVWSGLDERAVKYGYQPELLAWADEEVGNRGAQLVSTWAGSGLIGGLSALPALVGGGDALKSATGAGGGWGALVKGGGASGGIYLFGVGHEVYKQGGWEDFDGRYGESFSASKFIFSSGVGSVGGLATWQMLRWAGVSTGLLSSLGTAEGVVIRANNGLQGAAINRAGHAAIDHYERQHDERDDQSGAGDDNG